MTLLTDSLQAVQNQNFRPLILSQSQIAAILATPTFHEICFYLTKERRGLAPQEIGVSTLRYTLLNSSGSVINFEGKVVGSRFRLNPFGNLTEKFDVDTPRSQSSQGVTIIRSPSEPYFLDMLNTNLIASPGSFAGFFIRKLTTGGFEVNVAMMTADFGGAGGPGSTNTKPGP